MISDVELNRAINALSTTLRDQRPAEFDAVRFQAIVDGSLGGERKLVVRPLGNDRGRLTARDGITLASVGLRDGVWNVRREVDATGSGWAVPAGSGYAS